jgi:hypothetical protein
VVLSGLMQDPSHVIKTGFMRGIFLSPYLSAFSYRILAHPDCLFLNASLPSCIECDYCVNKVNINEKLCQLYILCIYKYYDCEEWNESI